MENPEYFIGEIDKRERQAKKRAIIFIFVSVVISLSYIFYVAEQIKHLQEKVTAEQVRFDDAKQKAELYERLRDSYRIQYLEAKGLDFRNKSSLLAESIKADSALKKLLEENTTNSHLTIKYYRKSLDQQKVWLSLKELGYKNIVELESVKVALKNGETNTVAFGRNIHLFDIKVISLILIRAGFKVQYLYYLEKAEKANDIEIIRTAPSDGSPENRPATSVGEIINAKSIDEIIRNASQSNKHIKI